MLRVEKIMIIHILATFYIYHGTLVSAKVKDLSTIDLSKIVKQNLGVILMSDSEVTDYLGTQVSGAGDVNGDGFDDIIIGAPLNDMLIGNGYVVFGTGNIESYPWKVQDLDGTNGFSIIGHGAYTLCGFCVDGTGDVNGDGFDDVIVSCFGGGNYGVGETFIIFGGETVGINGTVVLSDINGTNGFVINGVDTFDYSGFSVSGAGDFNGDGINDIIIGAVNAESSANVSAGETYVVYGSAEIGNKGSFELSSLNGTNGFAIHGIDERDTSGVSVSSAGDVNHDGYSDVIVGASGGSPNGLFQAGECYVLFGGVNVASSGVFKLNSLNGVNGFALYGVVANAYTGYSVSGAGDFNGDGFDDVIVGGWNADTVNGDGSGATYLVYGNTTVGSEGQLYLSDLNGLNGFTISGLNAGDRCGYSVSHAGDVNKDGFDDVIIGAHWADGDPYVYDSGESYILFGGNNTETSDGFFDLSRLDGNNGVRLDGGKKQLYSGFSVSGLGDINNDGFAEVGIGAPFYEKGGRVYIVSLNTTITVRKHKRYSGFTMVEVMVGIIVLGIGVPLALRALCKDCKKGSESRVFPHFSNGHESPSTTLPVVGTFADPLGSIPEADIEMVETVSVVSDDSEEETSTAFCNGLPKATIVPISSQE